MFKQSYSGYRWLRKCSLTERKQLLSTLCPPSSAVVYSEHIREQGLATFQAAKELGVEGVVGVGVWDCPVSTPV